MAGYHPLPAYHGEWHLRAAWSSLRFADEELPQVRQTRDAVKPASPSAAVQAKKAHRVTAEGLPVQSFDSLLMHPPQADPQPLSAVVTAVGVRLDADHRADRASDAGTGTPGPVPRTGKLNWCARSVLRER